MLFFEEWLHRKVDENAHNEILAFLLIILGVNLLIGGLLTIIVMVGEPAWLLVFPYTPPKTPSTYLGLILTSAGFALTSAGFILVIHYDRKKSWYIKELEKSAAPRKRRTASKSISEILEEYTGKRKKGECFEKIWQKTARADCLIMQQKPKNTLST